jgi:glycosyltransferase involved in cell wall biosynthesis
MKLLVISHMPHYHDGTQIVGWGPTAQELDHLATRFESVRHIACLHPGPPPASYLPYAATNLELVPVSPSGAEGFIGKLDVLRHSPEYVRTILAELPHADMVHVRAPAQIAMIAIAILSARRQPRMRWIKYAGNWRPDGRDAVSYRLQREWLARRWHRSVVTVNGEWKDQPPWVVSFYNPSLLGSDLVAGKAAAAAKRLTSPLRMLFVGVIAERKGAGRALEVVAELARRGIDVTLDMAGGGDELTKFQSQAETLGVAARVRFHGWVAKHELAGLYAPAHVQILPSATEGWPKVLSEGMAFGVVPIASAVSSIPQYLERFQIGRAVPPGDVMGFASAVEDLARDPARWTLESRRSVDAARLFSYDHYLAAIDELIAQLQSAS